MKQAWIIFCLLWIPLCGTAQEYPPEWVKYTFGEYVYDIQSDINNRNLSETDFKNHLLNVARTNLAKQIQVRVQDIAQLNKEAVDGRTSIRYSSQTNFSTDVNLKLLETRTTYDATSKTGYAIACINRQAARNYYNNELALIYNKVNNSVVLAENFVSAGFKSKAQAELESSLKSWDLIESPLLWINIFGSSQAELTEWQERFNAAERRIKSMLAELRHATAVYLTCSEDIFGQKTADLQNKLKGILADRGCNFVDSPANADWAIKVQSSAREYNQKTVNGANFYFAYVDATVTIDKIATSQRIYENTITEKGGHILSYREAARAAYKNLLKQLGETVINVMNQ